MVQTVHFMFYFTTRKKIISTYWEVIAVRKLCACLFLLVKSLFSLDLRWFFACLKNRYKLLFLLLKMCAWKRLFRQKKKIIIIGSCCSAGKFPERKAVIVTFPLIFCPMNMFYHFLFIFLSLVPVVHMVKQEAVDWVWFVRVLGTLLMG